MTRYQGLGEGFTHLGLLDEAERSLRRGVEILDSFGETGFNSTMTALHGAALCRLGRFEEALAQAERARELSAEDDFASQVAWRRSKAWALSARGDHDEAVRLVDEATTIVEDTDYLDFRAETAAVRGLVLRGAGRVEEARAAYRGGARVLRAQGRRPRCRSRSPGARSARRGLSGLAHASYPGRSTARCDGPHGEGLMPTTTQRPADLGREFEPYRAELTAYAYRMLGSAFEAEDAVQETMLRAWRSLDRFEGRSSVRSWLYRIATNVCLDMLTGKERRARPMDMEAPRPATTPLPEPLPEGTWILPVPDGRLVPEDADPAELVESRETIRLAFVAALQHLPPRQRAVLILREVLRWNASEVAELLQTSVASVNSALQRARATLEKVDVEDTDTFRPMDEEQRALLARYVDAFERYDMDSLTALLREDATWSMPPYDLWLRTHDDIRAWCLGPGIGCSGSRLIPVVANGSPAFGQYKPGPSGLEPWSLQVLEISRGRIAGISFFLDTERLFPLFGLPPRLDA